MKTGFRAFGAFARRNVSGGATYPAKFITVASDIPGGVAGKPYFFQFEYSGDGTLEVSGYGGQYTVSSGGAFYIPNAEVGTYSMVSSLREVVEGSPGAVVETLSWTLNIADAANLVNASITSTTLAPILFGEVDPSVPLDVSGNEPYTLRATGLPEGISSRPGFLTKAQLAVSWVSGAATLEGAGSSVQVWIKGASGVEAGPYTFASGIAVNRPPTFVGLNQLPQLPVNTPGSFNFAPFIRAYPAISGYTADPVLSTINANLGKSGLTLTYGNLTALSGQTTAPVTFTLDSNGVGTPASITLPITVQTSTVPSGTVVAAYDLSGYSASNGSEITSVSDLAQGAALPLSTALQLSSSTGGPAWNSTNKSAEFRAGDALGVSVDLGVPPWAIGLSMAPRSSSASGLREFMRSSGSFAYFDKGAAGGARPAFLSSTPAIKYGTRSSDTVSYSPASVISAIVVKVGHATSTDIVSSISVNNGGSPVSLSRVASAADTTGENVRSYIYFLGSGIPSGALTVTVSYASSITNDTWIVVEGYTATADVEVVNAPTAVQADTANPSITCDTTVSNRDCLATAILGSGINLLSGLTEGGSQTRLHTYTEQDGVRYDIHTRVTRTNTADPTTFTHTPVGTPKGVFMISISQNADHYSSYKYGGVDVPSVLSVSSQRKMRICFLGTGVPSGAQTASFDFDSATDDDMELLVVTVTADGDIEVIDSDSFTGSGTNETAVMSAGGRKCTAFSFGYILEPDPASVTAAGGQTEFIRTDLGTASLVYAYQTNPSRSDFSAGWTNVTAYQRTVGMVSVAPVVNSGTQNFIASRQTTGGTSDFSFSWTAASDDVALCAITMSEHQGSGAKFSIANNVLGETGVQTGVIDTKVRHIIYAASNTSGSYWKNGSKSSLTPAGAGNIAKELKNVIFHGKDLDWDLYKLELWRGTFSDSDATAMDTRLSSDRNPPSTLPPGPPTNVVAGPGDAVVNLSWTMPIGGISAKIERSTVGGGTGFSQIASGVTDAVYQDTGRTNGTLYYYRIRATGAGGDSGYSPEVSATPVASSVGAPQNNRISSISSTSFVQSWDTVAGASYDVYIGTATGVYSLAAAGVTSTSYTHSGLTNGVTYFTAVKAVVSGVTSGYSNEASATAAAATGITKNFPLIESVLSGDIPFTQYPSKLTFEASGAIQGRRLNNPSDGGGSDSLGHLADGYPFFKIVSKLVPYLGVNRNFVEMTLWNSTSFLYTSNNSIRATLACGPYDYQLTPGKEWFSACAFMLDQSLFEANPLLDGFDFSVGPGLHEAYYTPNPNAPVLSSFLEPVSSSEMKHVIVIRRHTTNNAAPGDTTCTTTSAELRGLKLGKYYEMVFQYRLAYLDSQGGMFRVWMYEDGVPMNGGNPYLDYTGRFGYNIPTPPGYKHQRRFMTLYAWRGMTQFDQLAANNISNIPQGKKGIRIWVRKSISIAGGTSGGVTVNKDSILNYFRLVE